MARLGSLVSCATIGLGIALAGCGSNTSSGGTGGSGGGAGGGAGGSGGGGSPLAVDAVPRSNAVAGWTVDPDNTKAAKVVAATATDLATCTELIDGAASDIYGMATKPTQFLWQSYLNETLTSPTAAKLDLYIMEFADAAQASSFYTEILAGNLWAERAWTDPSDPAVGSHSRYQDTGTNWWINFIKDKYYVEVNMSPSYGPPPTYTPADATTKAAAFAFAKAVADKL
jgi:hypothetical protein